MKGKTIAIEVLGLDDKKRALGLNFEDYPEENHILMLTELFRSALIELCGDGYSLKVFEREWSKELGAFVEKED